MNAMLDQAMRYASRGWHVFPLLRGMKVPFKGSRGVKDATTNKQKIKQWWTETPEANIAIATGQQSGIFAVDIDPYHGGDESLKVLQAENGLLPRTVTARTGGGGRHHLFRWPGQKVRNNNDGKLGKGIDVRGDSGYIVAAPSLHKTGALYEWAPELSPDDVQLADAPQWLLTLLSSSPQKRKMSPKTDSSDRVASMTIEEAIRVTLPDGPGQRRGSVFKFARALKAMPEYANASWAELKPIIQRWHDEAWPNTSQNEDLRPHMGQFCSRVAPGQNSSWIRPNERHHQRCQTGPYTHFAMRYESEEVRELVKLCKELQSREGANPFRLDCRTGGRAIEMSHTATLDRLKMLVADEVIELVQIGAHKRASRYRYLGD